MLKRVAVLGKDEAFQQSISRAAKGKDIEAVAVKSAAKLPAATAAVMGDDGSASALVKIALALGERQEQLLELLAEAIDCREGFLPGSSARVRDHATRLARALKLSADDQLTLERAALVRDIGKLKISNEVLLKDDVLTYDEWRLIHSHAGIGADLIATMEVLKDTEAVVRYHHECFDGTGYPNGLEADAIPYLARAMKVIDVFCAMTSPRHYRKSQNTHEMAVEHLQSERGKHFDPEIVAAFLAEGVGAQ